jgi:hypothetical protein
LMGEEEAGRGRAGIRARDGEVRAGDRTRGGSPPHMKHDGGWTWMRAKREAGGGREGERGRGNPGGRGRGGAGRGEGRGPLKSYDGRRTARRLQRAVRAECGGTRARREGGAAHAERDGGRRPPPGRERRSRGEGGGERGGGKGADAGAGLGQCNVGAHAHELEDAGVEQEEALLTHD